MGSCFWKGLFLLGCVSFIWSSAQAEGSRVRYFHSDHLSSTNLVTDRNANIVESTSYTPFGEIAYEIRNASDASRFQYTNQELDPESDLYNYGARFYDPALARFTSRDPVLSEPAYAYVHNNPICLIDPNGEAPESTVWVLYDLGMAGYYRIAQNDMARYYEYLGWAAFDSALAFMAPPGASAVAHAADGVRLIAQARNAYNAGRLGIETAGWAVSMSSDRGGSGGDPKNKSGNPKTTEESVAEWKARGGEVERVESELRSFPGLQTLIGFFRRLHRRDPSIRELTAEELKSAVGKGLLTHQPHRQATHLLIDEGRFQPHNTPYWRRAEQRGADLIARSQSGTDFKNGVSVGASGMRFLSEEQRRLIENNPQHAGQADLIQTVILGAREEGLL